MKLKDYLVKTGLKQSDLANCVGCSQAHISQVCNLGRRPSPDVAARISRACHNEVTVLDLLYPDGVVQHKIAAA